MKKAQRAWRASHRSAWSCTHASPKENGKSRKFVWKLDSKQSLLIFIENHFSNFYPCIYVDKALQLVNLSHGIFSMGELKPPCRSELYRSVLLLYLSVWYQLIHFLWDVVVKCLGNHVETTISFCNILSTSNWIFLILNHNWIMIDKKQCLSGNNHNKVKSYWIRYSQSGNYI